MDWLAERWNDLIDYLYSLLLSLFDALKDVAFWLVESLLNLCLVILSSLDSIFNALTITDYMSMFPDDVVNMLALLGINQITMIIVTALGVRFVLQLIPLVRLGS